MPSEEVAKIVDIEKMKQQMELALTQQKNEYLTQLSLRTSTGNNRLRIIFVVYFKLVHTSSFDFFYFYLPLCLDNSMYSLFVFQSV